MSATSTLIPVAQYLASSYRPDCDYLEGEVRERNQGDRLHSMVQGFLVGVLSINARAWGVRALPEMRVQVRPQRYRIPYVCVIDRHTPFERVLTHVPLLCIEVLSPDDSLGELQERVDDYVAMGVPHIWALDSTRRRAYIASTTGFVQPQGRELTIEGTPIRISLDELVAELDEAEQIR